MKPAFDELATSCFRVFCKHLWINIRRPVESGGRRQAHLYACQVFCEFGLAVAHAALQLGELLPELLLALLLDVQLVLPEFVLLHLCVVPPHLLLQNQQLLLQVSRLLSKNWLNFTSVCFNNTYWFRPTDKVIVYWGNISYIRKH